MPIFSAVRKDKGRKNNMAAPGGVPQQGWYHLAEYKDVQNRWEVDVAKGRDQ